MIDKTPNQDPDFEEGTHEGDIYDDEGQEELVEDDEISDAEEGFMEGLEHGEHEAVCAECKKVLTDTDNVIEEEINNERYMFCSEECANSFEVGKQRKRTR